MTTCRTILVLRWSIRGYFPAYSSRRAPKHWPKMDSGWSQEINGPLTHFPLSLCRRVRQKEFCWSLCPFTLPVSLCEVVKVPGVRAPTATRPATQVLRPGANPSHFRGSQRAVKRLFLCRSEMNEAQARREQYFSSWMTRKFVCVGGGQAAQRNGAWDPPWAGEEWLSNLQIHGLGQHGSGARRRL